MSYQSIEELEQTEVAGFIAKTFQILKNDEFAKIIFWASSGMEFVIKDAAKFQQIVLPRYFRHNKMNSFIRQLNMYGFHKSRNDHTKCVFSHPAFQKNRDDLLITIKRKIKNKNEELPQTPRKPSKQVEPATTSSKQTVETGHELRSNINLSFPEMTGPSCNILGTNERLFSIININVSINRLPMGDVRFDQENIENDDAVSIADKIEEEDEQEGKVQGRPSFKFINPSCFFASMRKPQQ